MGQKAQDLSGVARVTGGEPFKIVVAGNGRTAIRATASGGRVKLYRNRADGLMEIVPENPENEEITWEIRFK